MIQAQPKFETLKLPLMPVREVVVFPHMMTPFAVGRQPSVRALEMALAADRMIFLATQMDSSVDEPAPKDIYEVGTVATIVQNFKLPDGNIKVLVEGLERGIVLDLSLTRGYLEAVVRTMTQSADVTSELEKTIRRVHQLWDEYARLLQSSSDPITVVKTAAVNDPGKLSDLMAQNLAISVEQKQNLLEIFDPVMRLEETTEFLLEEIEGLSRQKSKKSS